MLYERLRYFPPPQYYLTDRRLMMIDPETNATSDMTTEVMDDAEDVIEKTVFEWTGAYSESYLEANFNTRYFAPEPCSLIIWRVAWSVV